MDDAIKFPRNAISVDGRFIAGDLGNATVIQDDDDNLWAVVAVDRIDVVLSKGD